MVRTKGPRNLRHRLLRPLCNKGVRFGIFAVTAGDRPFVRVAPKSIAGMGGMEKGRKICHDSAGNRHSCFESRCRNPNDPAIHAIAAEPSCAVSGIVDSFQVRLPALAEQRE